MYDKVNKLEDILSGDITVPTGYDREAHLKIIEFVHFVKEGAKTLAKKMARDAKQPKVSAYSGIDIDSL
jgi:hypothetical protein